MTAPFITGARWWPLTLGLVVTFALFDGAAASLGSDRGQEGLAVG